MKTSIATAAGLCALALAAQPVAAEPPRVTVIGDSVQESLAFSGHARAVLGRGIDLRPDGEAARLERRDPATGRRLGATRVPPSRALVATRRAAWLLEASGRVGRIATDGSRRVRLRRVRALASDGEGRLWALRSDGRTLLRLRPADGRVMSLGRTRHEASRLALTRGHLWLAAPGTRRLERVSGESG